MRWLSSVIDALKMGKTVKKILKASLTLKMSISRWNFSFQHKRSELQPHIWRLHKILRHSFSAWSKINDVNAKFFFCYFGLGVGTSLLLVRWVRNKYHHTSQKLISSPKILEFQKIDLLLVSTRGLALGFFSVEEGTFSSFTSINL